MRKSGITIVLALSLVFSACSTPSRHAVPKPGSERMKVSLVEPKYLGGHFNATIFEDMTRILVATFGAASVVRSVEDALASNPDIIVFLSITSQMATHNSADATIDVEAKFTGRQDTVLDEFHIHTSQRSGPFQLPHAINEGVRKQARAKMQQAILASPKLARIAKARPEPSMSPSLRPAKPFGRSER